jgi:hypothetical protein
MIMNGSRRGIAAVSAVPSVDRNGTGRIVGLSELLHESVTLAERVVHGEMELALARVEESVARHTVSIAWLFAVLALGLIAAGFGLAAIVAALATVVPLWAAFALSALVTAFMAWWCSVQRRARASFTDLPTSGRGS